VAEKELETFIMACREKSHDFLWCTKTLVSKRATLMQPYLADAVYRRAAGNFFSMAALFARATLATGT